MGQEWLEGSEEKEALDFAHQSDQGVILSLMVGEVSPRSQSESFQLPRVEVRLAAEKDR